MHLQTAAAKVAASIVMLALVAWAAAQDGVIRLNVFPALGVADGRSKLTVTAEVLDDSGNRAPDGTQVVFDTTLGSFREGVVETKDGIARAQLTASSVPGTATVTASVFRFRANARVEVEFVADRELLSSAREYIEVFAPNRLVYSNEERVMEAAGTAEELVRLEYRDIRIDAQDIQLNVPMYEVRARNARLRWGDIDQEFAELSFRLNQRKGFGTTVFEGETQRLVRSGLLVRAEPEIRERFTLVDVSSSGLEARSTPAPSNAFEYRDLSYAITTVEAKRAVAFPGKEVQFSRATVKMDDRTVMSVPLFTLPAHATNPVITDQFINLSNNQFTINYPYYLTLEPGSNSLLRFRYGNLYSGGYGATGGIYLDYEFNWNHGDEMQGGLTLTGLNREDWGVGLKQYWRADDFTTLSAQLDFPAHRSLFANASVSRVFDGFQADLNASHSRNIRGSAFSSESYSLIVEKDPMPMGDLPVVAYFGVTARQNSFANSFQSDQRQTIGAQGRFVYRPRGYSNISASYTLEALSGNNVDSPFAHHLRISTSQRAGPLSMQVGYDFVEDGFSSQFLGNHRISADAYYTTGPWRMSGFLSASLDKDRQNGSLNLNYRFSPLWRLNYSNWFDLFQGDSFSTQTIVLAYNLGLREVGLSYNVRTGRLGFEFLGTPIP